MNEYLRAVRSWIQTRFVRGDSVRWGSEDTLGEVTVRDLEELAERIAEESIAPYKAALRPFAAMHRPGCDPDELACQRGTAEDMTMLHSGDFEKVYDLLKGAE